MDKTILVVLLFTFLSVIVFNKIKNLDNHRPYSFQEEVNNFLENKNKRPLRSFIGFVIIVLVIIYFIFLIFDYFYDQKKLVKEEEEKRQKNNDDNWDGLLDDLSNYSTREVTSKNGSCCLRWIKFDGNFLIIHFPDKIDEEINDCAYYALCEDLEDNVYTSSLEDLKENKKFQHFVYTMIKFFTIFDYSFFETMKNHEKQLESDLLKTINNHFWNKVDIDNKMFPNIDRKLLFLSVPTNPNKNIENPPELQKYFEYSEFNKEKILKLINRDIFAFFKKVAEERKIFYNSGVIFLPNFCFLLLLIINLSDDILNFYKKIKLKDNKFACNVKKKINHLNLLLGVQIKKEPK